jgi:hypothetical protein
MSPNIEKSPLRRHDDVAKGVELSKKSKTIDYGEAAFLLAYDAILVGDDAKFEFDGSLQRSHMISIWVWLRRDVMPEIKEIFDEVDNIDEAKKVLQPYLPKLAVKAGDVVLAASANSVDERHLIAQIGGEEVKDRLQIILNILRSQSLLSKAIKFGRTANGLSEAELSEALLSLPLKEARVSPLLFHALIGQVKDPARLLLSVCETTGGSSEVVYKGAGFGPLIDGILAHAQNQIAIVDSQAGHFGDFDLVCRAIIRFHYLMRAVTGYVELGRGSVWHNVSAELTKLMAKRIEPRLNVVSFNINASLRKPRSGPDIVDADQLLSALNGIYLLMAVRDAKESLALNALFEKVWSETGKNMEILIDRNIEMFKQDPLNAIVSERLDMGIKMAAVRFGKEYGEVLAKSKEAISRRQKLVG